MKLDIKSQIVIPNGVEVKITDGVIHVKGPKGEVERKLVNPKLSIEQKEGKIVLSSKKASKREKTMAGTFVAHIENMLRGVVEPYVYKLKICSSHFPMTASAGNNLFTLKNFLGEKVPRTLKLRKGVSVKVDGANIVVESSDRELAGQTAASIEQLCRITNRDKRVFQDGIYVIFRSGREMQ